MSADPAVALWRQAAYDQRRRFEDLLASIELYVDWRAVTRHLTTDQRELFADAVDASSARLHATDPGAPEGRRVPRWWREDYPINDETKDGP